MKERNEHLFIVRVWREAPAGWRGFVEHIPTQQRVYFTDVAQIADVISLRLRDVAPNHADGNNPSR